MNDMIYKWGHTNYAVPAQVVGETVEDIAAREGYCPPSRLVEVASDDNSPLHPLFTWDDAEAALQWRTHQARRVINALTITVRVEDQEVTAPAFVSVGHVTKTQDGGEGYRPVSVVVQNPAYTEEALNEAVSRLLAIQKRYGAIQALAPVWRALEEIKAA